MNAMIIAASRYGSTVQGAEWIAERLALENIESQICLVQDAPPPDKADLVILGSGLYSHKLLPDMDKYIDRYIEMLCRQKIALFALAMRTTPVFVHGQAHGGLAQLDYLFKKLGKAIIHADMLGGQMAFCQLSEADAAGLERFYAMLKLTPDEIEQRKAPRTLMNKSDYWAFAEALLKQSQEKR